MKIGYLSTVYHTSFILKTGKFRFQQSDDTQWKLFPTGPGMMEAFENHEIDMGYIGLPPVMMGIERGLKLKCVGGGHVEGTVMIANDSYSTYDELGSVESVLEQFNGAIIGTPTKGSIHDVIIRNLIGNHKISIKNFKWAEFIPDALSEHEIEAAVGTPALSTVANMQMDTRIVVPPNKIWPYNPSYGIVVQEDLIQNEEYFIKSFLKAHEKACNLIRNNPAEAAEITAKEIGMIDKQFILNTYNISPRYCAKIPDEYIKSTMDFVPVLRDMEYMNSGLEASDVFELKFIEEVHTENAHY